MTFGSVIQISMESAEIFDILLFPTLVQSRIRAEVNIDALIAEIVSLFGGIGFGVVKKTLSRSSFGKYPYFDFAESIFQGRCEDGMKKISGLIYEVCLIDY
jgi:hypothetical protein